MEDPYIRARHQVHNFVRFCELVVKKCSKNLQTVELHTRGGEVRYSSELASSFTLPYSSELASSFTLPYSSS